MVITLEEIYSFFKFLSIFVLQVLSPPTDINIVDGDIVFHGLHYIVPLWRGNQFVGTAIIATEHYVITAAHNINKSADIQTYFIFYGNYIQEKGIKVNMKDRFFMKQWDESRRHDYDVVILQTQSAINFTVPNVDVAKISMKMPGSDINFLVSGYGFYNRERKALPNRLLYTLANYLPVNECQPFFKRQLSITEICSKNIHSTAMGDSGAPLIGRDMMGNEKVYGVLSSAIIPSPGSKVYVSTFASFFNHDIATFFESYGIPTY